MSAVALVAAAGIAVVDWWAVATRRRLMEYAAKPAVMMALIAAALAIEAGSGAVRAWFVTGLVLSLAGDVFLMLEREQFVAGLAAFLTAHVAYIAGMIAAGTEFGWLLVGLALAAGAVATVGRRIGAAVAAGHRALLVPVWAYITVISAMLAASFATVHPPAILGASLFYASDALLGWSRFVAALPYGRLLVIVPYHLGQALLVLALAGL